MVSGASWGSLGVSVCSRHKMSTRDMEIQQMEVNLTHLYLLAFIRVFDVVLGIYYKLC